VSPLREEVKMQKFIIPLLTVVMVVSIIFAGCAPATPPEQPPETSEQPPETSEQPPEEPEPPPTALPKPGVWTASTGATEFTFTVTVNPDGTGISQYAFEFEEFGFCGDYKVGKATVAITHSEPIPIHPLPSGAEFSFVDDQEVYSGEDEDPLPSIYRWIHIYWHIVIEGQFDETGTQASGTWEVSSAGPVHTISSFSSPPSSEGTVCQEGTWSASAP